MNDQRYDQAIRAVFFALLAADCDPLEAKRVCDDAAASCIIAFSYGESLAHVVEFHETWLAMHPRKTIQ